MVISLCFVRKVAEYGYQFVFCPQGGRILVISLYLLFCPQGGRIYGDQFVFCPQGGRI
jgi:hypothetical protein